MITALAAGVVSCSALFVSVYEAFLMRQQQAASVLPIMDFWAAYAPQEGYSLHLANKGLGPAFIRQIGVSVDDQTQQNWPEVLQRLSSARVQHNESVLTGSVLAPGDIGNLVTINDAIQAKEVWKQADRLTLQVCYCSVFENCWITTIAEVNTGAPDTEPVDACPSAEKQLF